ncbi:hypothetical protein TRIUR3_21188 [Triticum urartu]|uniref:Pectate lyase n=1 Tax=Triticum urartu TaxID=4572 RepID=M8A0P7_TRIUA|nr:hypothetical protein TRIUR3_21188 [Triticum urartu]
MAPPQSDEQLVDDPAMVDITPPHPDEHFGDDGPGSLRDGCRRQEPLWIVFDVSGTIRLASGLRVSSHKTVDGRGRRVTLSGKGLLLRECEHVILCNLEVEGGRGHDADAVQIKPGSRHVWVDRCSLRDFADGLLDVTCGSTDVTVSRCRFSAHDKAVLIGASSGHVGDRRIRVTIHHCLFDGTRQRQPRVRFGRVHLYNNYTRGWGIYAVCASVESQAADRDCSSSGRIRSEGDLFLNGAQEYTENDLETAEDDQWDFEVRDCYKPWSVQPASMALKELLESCTGWQPDQCTDDVKGKLPLKTCHELLMVSLDIEKNLHEVSLPFLLLHGGDDIVTDPLVSKLLFEEASSGDKDLKLYPGMWHALMAELPQDAERVYSDIISWLDQRANCAANVSIVNTGTASA